MHAYFLALSALAGRDRAPCSSTSCSTLWPKGGVRLSLCNIVIRLCPNQALCHGSAKRGKILSGAISCRQKCFVSGGSCIMPRFYKAWQNTWVPYFHSDSLEHHFASSWSDSSRAPLHGVVGGLSFICIRGGFWIPLVSFWGVRLSLCNIVIRLCPNQALCHGSAKRGKILSGAISCKKCFVSGGSCIMPRFYKAWQNTWVPYFHSDSLEHHFASSWSDSSRAPLHGVVGDLSFICIRGGFWIPLVSFWGLLYVVLEWFLRAMGYGF